MRSAALFALFSSAAVALATERWYPNLRRLSHARRLRRRPLPRLHSPPGFTRAQTAAAQAARYVMPKAGDYNSRNQSRQAHRFRPGAGPAGPGLRSCRRRSARAFALRAGHRRRAAACP